MIDPQTVGISSNQFIYRISIPEPANHLLHVELAIANWQHDFIDLKLPVWTPGSYLVREYAKHLQNFEATDAGKKSVKIIGASITLIVRKLKSVIAFSVMN